MAYNDPLGRSRASALPRIALIAAGLLIVLGAGFFLFAERGHAPQQAAAPPALPTPQEEVAAQAGVPSFDIVRVERDGSAVMAGRAVPGAEITAKANGEPLATATANANGEWVMVLETPLGPGDLELTLSARNPDGSVRESEQIVAVSVPERPDQPSLVVLSEPGAASRVLQGPGVPADAGNLILDVVDYDGEGNVIFSGRGDPDRAVRLYVAGELVGETFADSSGRWEVRPRAQIAPGVYPLRVDQLDGAGEVVARIELPFERAVPSAARVQLAGSRVVIQPGNSLWRIARRLYGSGFHYTVIYEANKDQIRDPDLIYPGQVFTAPGADPRG